MYAATNHNSKVLAVLLSAGAEVNAWDSKGMTALMWAALSNPNPEVTTTLLNAGADARAKSKDGKIAIDYAQTSPNLKGTDAYRQLKGAAQLK